MSHQPLQEVKHLLALRPTSSKFKHITYSSQSQPRNNKSHESYIYMCVRPNIHIARHPSSHHVQNTTLLHQNTTSLRPVFSKQKKEKPRLKQQPVPASLLPLCKKTPPYLAERSKCIVDEEEKNAR